jgi:hypothetical protein
VASRERDRWYDAMAGTPSCRRSINYHHPVVTMPYIELRLRVLKGDSSPIVIEELGEQW